MSHVAYKNERRMSLIEMRHVDNIAYTHAVGKVFYLCYTLPPPQLVLRHEV